MKAFFFLSLLAAAVCGPQAIVAAANAETNTVEELRGLRERVAALERALVEPRSDTCGGEISHAGSSYMAISFNALMNVGWSTDAEDKLNLGGHDPAQRGFSLPNEEIVLEGTVDPYFKGAAAIVLSLDEEGATSVELEDAFLLTTALPGNLEVKAGQFFTEFGRQNAQHPHQWAFVDQPLVLNRLFGPDGLGNPGARVAWLAPTPAHTELMLTVLNGSGETAWSFRNGEADFHGRPPAERGLEDAADFLYVPRLASSFDLTEAQMLVVGASAAFGPNDAGTDTRTAIYGADAYWKWKPSHAEHGFPFVAWQTEVLSRRFEAGAGETQDEPPATLPDETLKDWGLYSQLLWGFEPRWVAGLRGEFVTGDDGAFPADESVRGDRTRVSPNLTFYATDFSKFRLQYNYDDLEADGSEHSAWLQAEFALGAHAPH